MPALLDKVLRIGEGKHRRKLESAAAQVNAIEDDYVSMSDEELQAQTVDFATSNVRGAPVPTYIAGAKVLQNFPIGPLTGVAFNLTLLSYMDSMDMGVNIDTAAIAHPSKLRTHLNDAFARLRDG